MCSITGRGRDERRGSDEELGRCGEREEGEAEVSREAVMKEIECK